MSIRLFEPITIRQTTIKNRLWVAPMCMYSADGGFVNPWHVMHYGELAAGGFGLVTAEATAVLPEGRITPQCAGLWRDEHIDAWREVTELMHVNGALAGVQLQHAGRKGSVYWPFHDNADTSVPPEDGGWQTVAPSVLPFPGYNAPQKLDTDGINHIVDAFGQAARRADAAGFDVVEIHAAHGYLLHQFLSPLSNARLDDYGGTLDNRARIVREVARAIRANFPDNKIVMARFSATDWIDGGMTVEDTAQVVNWLAEDGVDCADISSGGLLPADVPLGAGYQIPLARKVKERVSIPVSGVGLITNAVQAEQVLVEGSADAIRVARVALGNPHWALEAAATLWVPRNIVGAIEQYQRGFISR